MYRYNNNNIYLKRFIYLFSLLFLSIIKIKYIQIYIYKNININIITYLHNQKVFENGCVVNGQLLKIEKVQTYPKTKISDGENCNTGFSVVFSHDFAIVSSLALLDVVPYSTTRYPTVMNPISPTMSSLSYDITIRPDLQTSTGNFSFTLNYNDQFIFTDIVSLICDGIAPEEFNVIKMYEPTILKSELSFFVKLNFTYEGYPTFSPRMTCSMAAPYTCTHVDTVTNNVFHFKITLSPTYQSISSTLNVTLIYNSKYPAFSLPLINSLFPYNVTSEIPLLSLIRTFPIVTNSVFKEDFTRQQPTMAVKTIVETKSELKSIVSYNVVDGGYYTGCEIVSNGAATGVSYLCGSNMAINNLVFFLADSYSLISNKTMTTVLYPTAGVTYDNKVTQTPSFQLNWITLPPIMERSTSTERFLLLPNSMVIVDYISLTPLQYIMRIQVGSNYEIMGVTYNGFFKSISCVDGTLLNGTWEIVFQANTINIVSLMVRNSRGDSISISPYQFYSPQFDYLQAPPLDLNCKRVMDFSKGEYDNVLYFNFTRPMAHASELFLYSSSVLIDISSVFKTAFDPKTNLYFIRFTLPRNYLNGIVNFFLGNNVYYTERYKIPNSNVTVINSVGDMLQPEINGLKAYPSNSIEINGDEGEVTIGWNITIVDAVVGFTYGVFEVRSNYDPMPRLVNVSVANIIGTGTPQRATYALYTTVQANCRSQNFTIGKITFGNELNLYNPLIALIGSPYINISEATINVVCKSIPENTPPKLIDFSFTETVNVYSLNRGVEFTFSVSDGDGGSGVSPIHNPYILLTSEDSSFIKIESSVQNTNGSYASYTAAGVLPYGFGFRSIVVSVYGLVDNQLNYAAYMSSDLMASNFGYYITRLSNPRYPFLESGSLMTTRGGPLNLLGNLFGNKADYNVLIDYKDGAGFKNTPINFISGVFLNVTTLPFPISIDVKVSKGGLDSNILTIVASDYIPPAPTTTPNITSTPNVTTTPNTKTCPGNPICNNKGKCNLQTLECECIPKWYGPSCASEIIIIPTPTPQPQPTSETTYVYDSKNITSVVEVIAVRELDDIYNVVNEYQISNWTLTVADPKLITIPTYYYQTQLGNTSTTLNVTIEFFTNQTERQFGDQNITLSPSSIKFSMSIGRYQFQSKTNYLQVVMAATIQGSDGSCSSKSIGSGNDNNVRWIKMNIDKTSLYGRFITYGIIDGNVRTIENRLIEDDEEPETSQTRTTKVGITIPNFDDSVLLDPDFSNLIDVNNDSNENEICQSKKKLSNGAIAGIVVGCVVAIALVIATVLYLRKRAKFRKEQSKMSAKLKKNEQQ
ncbi:hypothetical protein PPL_07458 [Heterostelium album PN500]|uniref:EGF-like domain-containing protein n=1 Tax=Heterostelium pallidum (strain ATCC 26659 / Pp 5 / PN500) TaxID=670386 RepID=D3BG07_HETP5|nr:hypothetical protein PPL_07458 [Heterostelium album PN500]EFA79599.1 hypothetical protein PPL_07458 [Heterostelium album PN500]|eukprot:XP_020431720.1 hypothetical protein PPL_07458 [Heterostelium album PN500]